MQLSKFAIASAVASLALLVGASVAEAGTVTTTFRSQFGWPTYTDDPAQGGTLLGPSEEVCAFSGPSVVRCPTGGVSYNTGGGDWPVQGLSAFPQARFMWAPGITGATTPADLAKYAFSRTFHLPGSPVAGSIQIAADDFAEIRVNGISVGSIGSVSDIVAAADAQSYLHPFDLTQYLRPGSNTITIIGQNGPAWYTCGFPGCTDGPKPYAQNSAMVVFAGSLTSQAP